MDWKSVLGYTLVGALALFALVREMIPERIQFRVVIVSMGLLVLATLIRDIHLVVAHANCGGYVPFTSPFALTGIGMISYRLRPNGETGR